MDITGAEKDRASSRKKQEKQDIGYNLDQMTAEDFTTDHSLFNYSSQMSAPSVQKKPVQKMAPPEEEELQMKAATIQKQGVEEEELQMKKSPAQKMSAPEEEELQMKTSTMQKQAVEEEELQMKKSPVQKMSSPEEEELQMKSATMQKQAVEEEELRMKRSPVQKMSSPEEEELQMKSATMQKQGVEEEELQMKKSPVQKKSGSGSGMPEDVQMKMESSFGSDFSGVNIHANDNSATEMGALAYTQGNDVHFAPGQYSPQSQAGQELLGHELTHVVQQRQGRVQATTQQKGVGVNDDPGLEKEADDMGKKASQGQVVKNVSASTGSMIQKTAQTEENLGEAVADSSEYFINNTEAQIRSGASFALTSAKIPSGCKIKRIRKGSATSGSKSIPVAYIEILDTYGNSSATVGAKYWTSFSNIISKSTLSDAENYFVHFSDTMVYKSPYGLNKTVQNNEQTTDKKLDVSTSTGYTVIEQCGKFVNIKQGPTEIGWVYKDDLASKDDNDRAKYMKSYKDWLETRYTEITNLTGQTKLDRIEGILSQAERNFGQIENGTYPSLDDLDKEPGFMDNENQSITPHELISTVRKFIILSERTIEGIELNNTSDGQQEIANNTNAESIAVLASQTEIQEESAQAENANTPSTATTIDNAGSLYSDRDWNSRLKVNQYRTQSDNLTSPESTCAATTFAMMVERMGYNRKNVIDAITTKLGTYSEYSSTDEAWKNKAEEFFNWHNSGSSNYRKTRGGNEGLLSKSKELGEKFKDIGQLEDLLHFYQYLLNNEGSTTITSSKSNNDKLRSGIEYNNDTSKDSNYSFKQIWPNSWDSELRKKLKTYLDEGCIISLSVYHKGQLGGTHIVSVQSIDSEGIVIDDPYGGINPDYRRTSKQKGDFYLPMGKDTPSERSSYNYKNSPDYSSTESDYAKRDFTYTAAQNLEENESRGDSKKITWEILNGSDMKVINYILVLEPK